MGSDPIEDWAHVDSYPVGGELFQELLGAIGIGHTRHFEGLADLPDVDVKCGHRADISRGVPPDTGV
jgi:hypothetical protein